MKKKIIIILLATGVLLIFSNLSQGWCPPRNSYPGFDGDPWDHSKSYNPDDSTGQNKDVYLLAIAPYIVIIKVDLGQNLSQMIKNPYKAKSDHPVNSYSEKRKCIRTQRTIRR